MKLAVFIPAFNEEQKIGYVIDSIKQNIKTFENCEIIVVDDGSTDKTPETAGQHGADVISHKKNRGLGVAFQTGLAKALKNKVDILVTIDADGQFDPKEIEKLIEPILKGQADIVTGSRFKDKEYTPENMPWIKQWGNKRVAAIISRATGEKFYDVSCGFRAYSREAMLALNLFGKFTYTQETFLDLIFKGFKIIEIPVSVKYFNDRKSKMAGSILRYAVKSADIMFKTIKDYKPLKFFGWSGFLIFIVGLALDIFVFAHFFRFGTFSPYKILGFLGAFLNSVGIMVFFIGILADLIDRVRMTQEKILYYEKKRFYDSDI